MQGKAGTGGSTFSDCLAACNCLFICGGAKCCWKFILTSPQLNLPPDGFLWERGVFKQLLDLSDVLGWLKSAGGWDRILGSLCALTYFPAGWGGFSLYAAVPEAPSAALEEALVSRRSWDVELVQGASTLRTGVGWGSAGSSAWLWTWLLFLQHHEESSAGDVFQPCRLWWWFSLEMAARTRCSQGNWKFHFIRKRLLSKSFIFTSTKRLIRSLRTWISIFEAGYSVLWFR